MAVCEACGNDYEGTFRLTTAAGEEHTFDTFECAISTVAPRCQHCDVQVIGHGIQHGTDVYCCAHCARESGVDSVSDNSTGT